MKYTTKLKALEPKRWWHYLGIKRQYVDFNIEYSTDLRNRISIEGGTNTDITIESISVKEVKEDFTLGSELVDNGKWEVSTDWNIKGGGAIG